MSRELNAQIKNEIKTATGCKARDISVRTSYSRISVEIKNPFINIADVEKVAKKYESIDRDKYTGEILLGGNTYVQVFYDRDCFNEVAKDFEVEAKKMIDEVSLLNTDEGKFFREHLCLTKEYWGDFILSDIRNHKSALIYKADAVNILARQLFKIETFGTLC